MSATNHMNKPPSWRGMMGAIVLGAVLPLAGSVAAHFWMADQRWDNLAFHASVEAVGAFAALSLAVLILVLQRQQREAAYRVWIACGLASMGVLDAFHGSVGPGSTFVWLRSLGTLAGGLFFALVWLPESATPV
ncbi:MAG: hypothetical protein FJ388_09070, partial [Verrucomicrobia bacterium]|nr:hypothetical protein [Verrucomicrobiota bacterium]